MVSGFYSFRFQVSSYSLIFLHVIRVIRGFSFHVWSCFMGTTDFSDLHGLFNISFA
jgi:hypothetical protein